MLTHLSIRNVVLIEALAIDFARGLSALTGETGAGKSILLDALGLALGGRSDVALMKAGAGQASVSAAFALDNGHPALAILTEQGLAEQNLPGGESELVLRRQISRDGRSRAFVNDQAVSVALLRQLGDSLLEVQGQFEQRGLLDPATHRELLDAFAGLEEDAGRLAQRWRAWRKLEEDCAQAAAALEAARREEAFLRHALTELTAFAPESGEAERLAEARSLWRHREKLSEAVTGALGHLGGGAGNGGAERALAAAQRLLERAAPQAGQRLAPALAALERAAAELTEASQSLSALASDLEGGNGNGEAIEERYFALLELARKHKIEPDALPALIERLAEQLAALDQGGESLAALNAARDKAAHDYRHAAEALSAARAKAAKRLDKAVMAELPPLKLASATFATRIERLPEGQWGEKGLDRVGFEVATNPESAAGPIHRIASGGELARFLLAIKVVLAAVAPGQTLVFDEVDAGIGGATAHAVGERLAELARERQVLVVTHSPQVAARAGHHLKVAKARKGGGTVTSVEQLGAGERREELARMLAGATITDEARAAADRLLGAA